MFEPGRNLGTVLALDGDFALVLHERFDPCILCPGEDDCSEKERSQCALEVRARNEVNAAVGDTVALKLADESQILRAILYVYGVPLASLIVGLCAGVVAAGALGAPSTLQGGAGVVGLVVALGLSVPVSRRLNRRALETGLFTPVVAEVTSERLEV